jgi:hypothetical protein
MKKIFALLFFTLFYTSQSAAMTDKEICDARANIMEYMATERDSGKNKKQVKKLIQKRIGIQLPKSFEIYIDAVFEFPEASPKKMRDISLYSCYQEFGLIK